jgi:hypothetical protein
MKRLMVMFTGFSALVVCAAAAIAAASTTVAQAATSVASPGAAAIAVQGTNGEMYVQAPQLSPGWQAEGGQIVAPPAVVASPNPDGTTWADPLFIATGSTSRLYIRSLSEGWQQVGPVPAECLGSPAAMITGATLYVACEGTNKALYYNTTTVPTPWVAADPLPTFTTPWISLGGELTAGPAVAEVGGNVTFFVRGTTGHIYTYSLATPGFTATSWQCIGHPAAALQAATGVTIFGCEGLNHALWEATYSDGWSPAAPLRGVLVGGAAVAGTSADFEFFCEGKAGAVYERTLTTSWSSLGGTAVYGIGAAALN